MAAQNVSSLARRRLIGSSPWAATAREAIATHAAHDEPPVVEGEPGAGKRFVASLVHEYGDRTGPFLSVSCGSVSDATLSSLLFGSAGRRGPRPLVERALGGTLYVDASAGLSPALAAKIERFLEMRSDERAHGAGPEDCHALDVRLVLGIAPGATRPASVLDRIEVAPLRRRAADVAPLSRHFAAECCLALEREEHELSDDVVEALRSYSWPGNVVELKAVVEEMVRRAPRPRLEAALLPSAVRRIAAAATPCAVPADGVDLGAEVARYERALLRSALERCHGSQTRAAKLLGLKLSTLNAKVRQHSIDVAALK